jgi:hypothetical protein
MAEAADGHLQDEQLAVDAQKAAEDCRDFLRNAKYRPLGNYEICDDSIGLKEHSAPFYALFAPWMKVWICGVFLDHLANTILQNRMAANSASMLFGSLNAQYYQ